ncbi:hypothetical protein [Hydrogenimonas sp.]
MGRNDVEAAYPFPGQILMGQPIDSLPPVNRFDMKVGGHVLTLKSFYEERFQERHLVKIGAEFRDKKAKIETFRFNDYALPDRSADIRYTSAFLQDQFWLRPNLMLSGSMKFNHYDLDRDGGGEDDRLDTWQGRVAVSKKIG